MQKLDGLVKGYRPDYEFHGVPVPPTPAADPSTASDDTILLATDTETDPSPSKSFH
ncbi:MAG: hypothetical protein M1377_05750 [Deltaproteobacteria bacterium]|nr:hypothetical protein [Deltaproteobacteria bacterium]